VSTPTVTCTSVESNAVIESPIPPSDGVATDRPDGGQDCDGIDETKPVSSHDIIRWLREAPSPPQPTNHWKGTKPVNS